MAPHVRHRASGPTDLPLGRVLPTRWVGRTAGLEVLEKREISCPTGNGTKIPRLSRPARSFDLCVSGDKQRLLAVNW